MNLRGLLALVEWLNRFHIRYHTFEFYELKPIQKPPEHWPQFKQLTARGTSPTPAFHVKVTRK